MGLDEIRKLKENAKLPKEKKVYRIPKKSAKKIADEKTIKENQAGETELVKWFKGRMKFMSGKCCNCGDKTETKKYEFAIGSIAHILEKRNNMFPSVKYHPQNFIELCYPCHQNFDNFWSWEEKQKLKCWPQVVEKFIMIEPDIAQGERKLIPDCLQKIVTERNPFNN
jgi:hypothetical protein